MDWPTTTREFARIFGPHQQRATVPRGISGQNFMTPDLLGFVAASTGEVVEVSTGTGFSGERIFGVTFARLEGGRVDPRDTALWSLTEVAELLGIDAREAL